MSEKKLGPVEPRKDPWLWKQVFRQKIIQAYAGKVPPEEIPAEQIDSARMAATEALGFSLEEAEKSDLHEDAKRELRYARKRTGEEELACCEPEVL